MACRYYTTETKDRKVHLQKMMSNFLSYVCSQFSVHTTVQVASNNDKSLYYTAEAPQFIILRVGAGVDVDSCKLQWQ